MIHTRHSLGLIAPLLAITLSGCGVWDNWRHGMNHHGPTQTAEGDWHAYQHGNIQPGHSTDPDTYNENYAPYSPAPTEQHPMDRITPPPVPPSRSDIPPSKPDQPIIEQDVRLKNSAETGGQLIKTQKAPGIFSPDAVRSIYDRFRGPETKDASPEKPAGGPIAQRHILNSPTRACQYTTEQTATAAVQLGLPETDSLSDDEEAYPLATESWTRSAGRPAVTQACPSSFKHPLLADPTGVPYGVR